MQESKRDISTLAKKRRYFYSISVLVDRCWWQAFCRIALIFVPNGIENDYYGSPTWVRSCHLLGLYCIQPLFFKSHLQTKRRSGESVAKGQWRLRTWGRQRCDDNDNDDRGWTIFGTVVETSFSTTVFVNHVHAEFCADFRRWILRSFV